MLVSGERLLRPHVSRFPFPGLMNRVAILFPAREPVPAGLRVATRQQSVSEHGFRRCLSRTHQGGAVDVRKGDRSDEIAVLLGIDLLLRLGPTVCWSDQ